MKPDRGSPRWARVGAFLAKHDPYAPMYREALEHAGLRVDWIEECTTDWLEPLDVLLLCGRGSLSDTSKAAVKDWVETGGVLVCGGDPWGLHETLRLEPEGTWVSNATAAPCGKDRLWPSGCETFRFFGGTLARATGGKPVVQANGLAAATREPVRRGHALYVAPHVGQTMQLMQMGRSVECDAVGPSDGSATLDDGLLRDEDGTALSFEHDRSSAEGSAPFFGQPHADAARELWIRAVLNAVDLSGAVVPLLWHWPGNASGTAMLSLECEGFETDRVFRVYRSLAMFGCPAAWMVRMPGFSLNVFRALRSWDHEVGLLFETDDGPGWHEERMKIQLTGMRRASARPVINSIRAVGGRWKGYTRPYELAEAAGARVHCGRGGRQPGTQGFLFGTAHPFFPVRPDGSSFYVAEMPVVVHEPGVVTADAVSDALLEQVRARHGCFHVSATPESFDNQTSFNAIRRLLSLCKQNRLDFILPEQVFQFEKARRALRMTSNQTRDDGFLHLTSETGLEELTLLLSGPAGNALVRGREAMAAPVERYGTSFHAVTLKLEPKQQVEVAWDFGNRKAA